MDRAQHLGSHKGSPYGRLALADNIDLGSGPLCQPFLLDRRSRVGAGAVPARSPQTGRENCLHQSLGPVPAAQSAQKKSGLAKNRMGENLQQEGLGAIGLPVQQNSLLGHGLKFLRQQPGKGCRVEALL